MIITEDRIKCLKYLLKSLSAECVLTIVVIILYIYSCVIWSFDFLLVISNNDRFSANLSTGDKLTEVRDRCSSSLPSSWRKTRCVPYSSLCSSRHFSEERAMTLQDSVALSGLDHLLFMLKWNLPACNFSMDQFLLEFFMVHLVPLLWCEQISDFWRSLKLHWIFTSQIPHFLVWPA